MKRIFTLIALIFLALSIYAQDEDQWIFLIDHNPTEECIDSVNCYTEIVVELNLSKLYDSTNVLLKIGSMPDGDDIYNKQYLIAPSMYTYPEVTRDISGNALISLGKYITNDNFFVDMVVQY